MDVFRNPLSRSDAERAVARRHKAWLEMFTAAASVFCGVFFGAVFIAEYPRATSALWGLGLGLVSAASVAVYRARRPAHLTEPQFIQIKSEPASDGATTDDPDERAGWDFSNIVIAAIFLPPLLIIGLLTVCWLPILIIVGFALQVESVSNLGIVLAIACTFATMGAAEYGVSMPLAKRWNLADFDE